MGEQTHQSDPRVLNRRTLERHHPRLASWLHPGLHVLDVGCGTGAITAGIAARVGPHGSAVGVDRDTSLLEIACREHAAITNLQFLHRDVTALDFQDVFDSVSAARTLQWISRPERALAAMVQAAKPDARIVVLDYNHRQHQWEPDPPATYRRFHQAFLDWREANDWDNAIADHLPGLFTSAGLTDVQSTVDSERVTRGVDADFPGAVSIWLHVLDSLGPVIVNAGALTAAQLHDALRDYREFVEHTLQRQVLAMRTVTGKVRK